MDCSKFALETAQAFTQVFEIGTVYGAIILLVGFALGALVFYRRGA